MSIKAMTWAWELEELPLRESMVLLALADAANDAGLCWPSQDTLAMKSRGSVRSVKRAISYLKDAGLVSVSTRATQNGRRSNLYRVHVGAEFSLANNQRAKLALSETSVDKSSADSSEELVENRGLPTEITKGPNWHFAEGDSSQGDMGGPLQGDTGGPLAPYIDLEPKIEPPFHSKPAPVVENRDGGNGVEVPLSDTASAGPSGLALEWDLIRACLPEKMRAMDARGIERVQALLRERVDAGWKPAQLRTILDASPMPSVVHNLAGLVISKVQGIPVEGAPSAGIRRVDPPSGLPPEPVADSTPPVDPGSLPQWFKDRQAAVEEGSPDADQPMSWWMKRSRENGKASGRGRYTA